MSKDELGYQLELMVDQIGTGMTYVRSKDIPGLHLVGKDFQSMRPIIEKAIKRLWLDTYKQAVRVVFLANVTTFNARSVKLPSTVAVFKEAA